MPHDRPPGSGPYPLEPDTDESPPTEEVLDTVLTEEVRRDGSHESDDDLAEIPNEPDSQEVTDALPRLNTEDQWYDPDAGAPEELSVGRRVLPWVALLGGLVVAGGLLWGLGVVSLPGLSADGGKAQCERTCSNLGTTVLRYDQDECVCKK